MGRLIVRYRKGNFERFKCRSKERAAEIVAKRPNVTEWNFYEDNQVIPRLKIKKIISKTEETIESLIQKMQRGFGRF